MVFGGRALIAGIVAVLGVAVLPATMLPGAAHARTGKRGGRSVGRRADAGVARARGSRAAETARGRSNRERAEQDTESSLNKLKLPPGAHSGGEGCDTYYGRGTADVVAFRGAWTIDAEEPGAGLARSPSSGELTHRDDPHHDWARIDPLDRGIRMARRIRSAHGALAHCRNRALRRFGQPHPSLRLSGRRLGGSARGRLRDSVLRPCAGSRASQGRPASARHHGDLSREGEGHQSHDRPHVGLV